MLSGKVRDKETKEPIEFALVRLYNVKDSLIAGTLTKTAGSFEFKTQANNRVKAITTFIGYKSDTLLIEIKEGKSDYRIKDIELSAIDRKQVEIIDERPAYQVFEDKKVYQVDKDPLSTIGSASDILQNIPAVNIDPDGNVKLRGAGVTLLIDGRPSGMMGMTRKEALEFIPANMIESIEIMNNPSSRYDAGGEGGIINIILKKPKRAGIHAMAIASIGTEGKHNAAVLVNVRAKKYNITAQSTYRYYTMTGYNNRVRESYRELRTGSLRQNQNWKELNRTLINRIRFEWTPDTMTEVGIGVMIKQGNGAGTSFASYRSYKSDGSWHSFFDRDSPDTSRDGSVDFTFAATRRFRKKGHQISVNALVSNDYENTTTGIVQRYFNASYIPFNAPPLKQNIVEHNLQYQYIYQADYDLPIGKGKIESGIKSSYRNSDLDYQFLQYDYNSNSYFSLSNYTNHYQQNQLINAGYFIYRNKIKKFTYKGGVRVEETHVNSYLLNTRQSNIRRYINFFPSISLMTKLSKDFHLTFNYTKRINRPNIKTLNPFYRIIDASTVRTGNPNIQTEYTHGLELSGTKYFVRTTWSSSVYYRKTLNATQRITVVDSTGIALTTFGNFKNDQDLGFETFATSQITKKYRINAGFNGYQRKIDGSNINPIFVSKALVYSLKLNQYWHFNRDFIAQLSTNYQSPSLTPLHRNAGYWTADLSIKKTFFRNKLICSVRISDLFLSRVSNTEVFNPYYHIWSNSKRNSRIYFLTITFRPGYRHFKNRENLEEEELNQIQEEAD